jgi:hypothetical protein
VTSSRPPTCRSEPRGLRRAARSGLDEIVRRLPAFGWSPLFADRYPRAGGPDHYAAYLENDDGFEVELVAT